MGENIFESEAVFFGKYLNCLRNKANISAEEIGRGICSGGEISLLENGKRSGSKLMRDMLLERTGMVHEEHETFLNPDEYKLWAERQKIVRSIILGKNEEATELLDKYERNSDETDVVEKQFICVMRILIKASDRNAHELNDELMRKIGQALSLTYTEYAQCRLEGWSLSIKEICLLIEYFSCETGSAALEKYETIYAYISHREYLGNRARTFIMATLAYKYMDKLIGAGITHLQTLRKAFAMGKEAIQLLTATGRLYYFKEINLNLRTIVERLRKDEAGEAFLQKDARFTDEIDSNILIIDKLEEVSGSSLNKYVWPYAYLEEGCYCIGEVIKQRRKMLGLTRKELAEDICTEKTIVRTEKGQTGLHYPIMRELLERLGMSGEYEGGYLILTNPAAKEIEERVDTYANRLRFREALEENEKLKSVVAQTAQNMQFIMGNEAILLYRMEQISQKEFLERQAEALKYTVDFDSLKSERGLFLTRNELSCIYRMVLYQINQDALINDIFDRIVRKEQKKQELFSLDSDIRVFELLACAKAKKDRIEKGFEEGLKTCDVLIKSDMMQLRMGFLPAITHKIRILRAMREGQGASEEELKLYELYELLKSFYGRELRV